MDEDRRRMDELFRRELGERLKALEKTTEFLRHEIDKIQTMVTKFHLEQLDLHYTLFGGPKSDDLGLLEKFRKMAMRDRWIIWIIAGAIGFGGKLASPFYNKLVSDWAYNSVSERYMREHSKPHIKHYTIVQKQEPDEKD